MTEIVDSPALRLDPAERWDYLLTLENPTDQECLRGFATEAGVTTLSKFPNILTRATKACNDLPDMLSKGPNWAVVEVQSFLVNPDYRRSRIPIPTVQEDIF
jgi:hypothetical protein